MQEDNIIKDGIIVRCPICKKILFVRHKDTKGQISIKCLRCKNINKIELD